MTPPIPPDLARRDHAGASLEQFQPDPAKAMQALGLNPANPLTHAALLLANTYGLDPVLGHIKIIPGKGSQPATIWLTRDAYLFKALQHPEWGGIDLVEEDDGGGPPDGTYFCRVVCRRKGYPDVEGRAWYKWRQAKASGGSYIDENADEMCLQRAERRALRRQFPLSIFGPELAGMVEDGEPTAAPGPVVEVARMVDGKPTITPAGTVNRVVIGETSGEVVGPVAPASTAGPRSSRAASPDATSGVGADAPEAQAGPESPTPGPTSGEVGEREPPTTMGQVDRHDPTSPGPTSGTEPRPTAAAARTVPGSTSDPWGLAPPAPGSDLTSGGEPVDYPRQAVDAPPDQTSPPPKDPGKADGGGDSNPPDDTPEDGDAIPADLAGEGPEGSVVTPTPGLVLEGGNTDVAETATTGPTPPNASLTQAWCHENGQDMRIARVHLRRTHPDEFKDLKDWRDLNELEGERAALAVKRLDQWLANAKAHGGDS